MMQSPHASDTIVLRDQVRAIVAAAREKARESLAPLEAKLQQLDERASERWRYWQARIDLLDSAVNQDLDGTPEQVRRVVDQLGLLTRGIRDREHDAAAFAARCGARKFFQRDMGEFAVAEAPVVELLSQLCAELDNSRLRNSGARVVVNSTPSSVNAIGGDQSVPQESHRERHVVLLVHGILTDATWGEKLASEIDEWDVGLEPLVFRYQYFDLVKFLLPGPQRRKPASMLNDLLNELYARERESGVRLRISAICHSFGTYTICRLLCDRPHVTLDRLVLCGSVLPRQYQWGKIRRQLGARVLNECGESDVLPVFASAFAPGYGSSGSKGFAAAASEIVRDRFHAVDHFGYLSGSFARKYWFPYLINGQVAYSSSDRNRSRTPRWHSMVADRPWWIALYALLLIVLSFEGHHFVVTLMKRCGL